MTRPWPTAWRTDALGALCLRCGQRTGRPILMGMPSPAVFEAFDAGEIDIELGGSCISDEDLTRRCAACCVSFGRRSTAQERT